MKLEARQVAGFLRAPGGCRLVLLYGDDEGLIRERCQALTMAVAGTLGDPFLVTELTRDGWGRIPAEMAALSMIGGRRVVVVRDAGDAVLAHAQTALKGPGAALLVLEAAGVGRGKLRSFAEAAPDAMAIACYPDEGAALAELIRAGLAACTVRIDRDALAWLAQALPSDRAVIRGEVEKLGLLAGPGGTIDLESARLCSGEMSVGSADDGVLAALAGHPVAADQDIERAMHDGLAGVALLRMTLGLLQRLHQARLRMDGGLSAAEAARTIRPPVFYRAVTATIASLTLWPSSHLLRAIEETRQAELACKTTGSQPELLARRLVSALARQAKSRRTRMPA